MRRIGSPLGELPRTTVSVCASVALVLGSPCHAAPVDGSRSRIVFTATQMDVSLDGSFARFTADVDFDPAKPETGKVDLVITVASVATGSAEADDLPKAKEFFDAAHFSQATFTSRSIAPTGAGQFQALGELSLKGRRAAISVPFSVRPEGGGLRIDGSVPVSRLTYRVGEGQWADPGTLADQVQIRFSLYLPR